MAMNITIPKMLFFFFFFLIYLFFFVMNRKIINETNQQIQLKRQKPKIKDQQRPCNPCTTQQLLEPHKKTTASNSQYTEADAIKKKIKKKKKKTPSKTKSANSKRPTKQRQQNARGPL
jgi:hypothetical protein